MKTYRLIEFTSALLLAGLLAGVVGCASRGYKTNERTTANLQSLATRIVTAGRHMDVAVTELDGLINSPQPDLRPQFNRFSDAVSQLNTLATNLAKAKVELESRGKLHVETLEQNLATIQSEDIRATAKARKEEIATRFESVRSACSSVETAVGPVRTDLTDVQRYLDTDLTLGGLNAIKGTATRVGRNAAPAQESVAKLVSELRALAVAMAPQNGPAPTAAPASAPTK
jgi:hypothetical protein